MSHFREGINAPGGELLSIREPDLAETVLLGIGVPDLAGGFIRQLPGPCSPGNPEG